MSALLLRGAGATGRLMLQRPRGVGALLHSELPMTGSTTAPTGYSRLQVTLHWLIAALVLFQLFAREGMVTAWAERLGAPVSGGNPVPHIIVGVLILLLAATRLTLRLRLGVPDHPPGQPVVFAYLASAVHWAFYALIFLLPLSGLAAWFGGAVPAAGAHQIMQALFLPLIGLHLAGVLMQQFYYRSSVLSRMTRPTR